VHPTVAAFALGPALLHQLVFDVLFLLRFRYRFLSAFTDIDRLSLPPPPVPVQVLDFLSAVSCAFFNPSLFFDRIEGQDW